MRPSPASRFGGRAFTLLEVILAASIFVLLAGGVYLIVSTAVSAAAEVGEMQIEARQISAFQDFLRDGFANLSDKAELRLRAVPHGSLGESIELVVNNAGSAFAIGGSERDGSSVILGAVPEGGGRSFFAITRFSSNHSSDGELDEHLKSTRPLPLLEHLENVRWRFWDKTQRRFVETWNGGTDHPAVIELVFQLSGEPPTTCLFHLTPLS